MRKILLYIFTALICVTALVLYLQKDRLHDFVTDKIIAIVEENCGLQIRLGQISYSLIPLNVHVKDVTILYNNESIALLGDLTVKISLWDLLHNSFGIKSLEIDSASLFSMPTSKSSAPFTWQTFNTHLRIHCVHIHNLYIAPHLISFLPHSKSEFPRLELEAKVEFNSIRQEAYCDIWLRDLSNKKSRTTFSLGAVQKTEALQIQLRAVEQENSLLTTLFELPSNYSYQIFVEATSHANDWKNLPQLFPEAISGSFQVSYLSSQKPDLFLGPKGYLESDFNFSKNRGITLQHLAGNLSDIDMVAALSIDQNHVFQNSIIYLNPNSDCLENFSPLYISEAPIKLAVNGTWSHPQIICNSHINEISLESALATDIEFESSCQYQDKILTGSIKFTGKCDGESIAFSSTFEWNDKIQLHDARFTSPQSSFNGSIAFEPSSKHIEAKLNGETHSSLLKDLLALELSSPLSFQASLDGSLAKHILRLDLNIPAFKYTEFSFENSQILLKGLDLIDSPRVELNLSCKQAFCFNTQLVNFKLSTCLNFLGNYEAYDLNFELPALPKCTAKGYWKQAENRYSFLLQQIEGLTLDHHPFKLIQPSELSFYNGSMQFSPLGIDWDGCRIELTPEKRVDSFSLTFQALNLPLKFLYPYNNSLPNSGVVDLYAAFNQIPTTFSGQAKVNFKDISLIGSTFPLNGELSVNIKEKELHCNGFIEGIGDAPMQISAKVPIFMQLTPFEFRWEKELPLFAECNLHGPLEPILEMILPNSPVITGHAFLNLKVLGTLASPQFMGEADLKSGSLDFSWIGLNFKNVDAHFDIETSSVLLTHFSGSDEKGTVHGKGKFDLDAEMNFPFNIDINLSQVAYKPSDFASSLITGTMQLKGNLMEGSLSGTVATTAMEVNIPQQIPELAKTVEITYVNPPDGTPVAATTTQRSKWPLALDIEIDVPEKGMINGKDWSSEWKGHVSMKGTAFQPLLWGNLKLVKGEYRLNGHPFEFKEGTITYAGELNKKTSLYVIASRNLDELIAEIIVKGPIRNPVISFRSNPPMPQREILSWLLFGRGSENITPFQGTELNESITNLNAGGHSDMLTRIKDSFGVDKIDINRSSSNEVSIQVGKYISQGLLVSVNKSVTAEANQVAIEAEIMENVKVQAQIGDDSQGQLRLKWRKDY